MIRIRVLTEGELDKVFDRQPTNCFGVSTRLPNGQVAWLPAVLEEFSPHTNLWYEVDVVRPGR